MKAEVKIRNWAVIGSLNPYQAPEICIKYLTGSVENHPKLGSSNSMVSGPIENLDLKGRRVETRNTIYLLEGPPNESWIEYLKQINYDLNRLPE
jgi:hypothetical protein